MYNEINDTLLKPNHIYKTLLFKPYNYSMI